LYAYVEYKPAEYGINVEQVAPENTSRRCPDCGFTHPDNRESESLVWLREPRRLQYGEEHWIAVSPPESNWLRWGRTRMRALERRDVEREWRV
jgi:Putative transposase DNA-binding domain.